MAFRHDMTAMKTICSYTVRSNCPKDKFFLI